MSLGALRLSSAFPSAKIKIDELFLAFVTSQDGSMTVQGIMDSLGDDRAAQTTSSFSSTSSTMSLSQHRHGGASAGRGHSSISSSSAGGTASKSNNPDISSTDTGTCVIIAGHSDSRISSIAGGSGLSGALDGYTALGTQSAMGTHKDRKKKDIEECPAGNPVNAVSVLHGMQQVHDAPPRSPTKKSPKKRTQAEMLSSRPASLDPSTSSLDYPTPLTAAEGAFRPDTEVVHSAARRRSSLDTVPTFYTPGQRNQTRNRKGFYNPEDDSLANKMAEINEYFKSESESGQDRYESSPHPHSPANPPQSAPHFTLAY